MTDAETIALLPCPFCGKPASLVRDGGNEVYPQSWSAGCVSCAIKFKAYGSSSWAMVKKEDAAATADVVARWNLRAAQPAPVVTDEMVERDQDLIGRLLAEAKVWPRSDISGLLREAANALTAGLTPRDDAGEG